MGGFPRLTGPQLPVSAMGTLILPLGDPGGGSQLNKCQTLQYFSFWYWLPPPAWSTEE